MKRELKKGSVFVRADGVRVAHFLDGTITAEASGKVNKLKGPELDITQDEFDADPTLWTPTPEEAEKAQEERVKHEKEYWVSRGFDDIPEGVKEVLNAKERPVLENKMLEPAASKGDGCPECGGPAFGRGYKHADTCSRKR